MANLCSVDLMDACYCSGVIVSKHMINVHPQALKVSIWFMAGTSIKCLANESLTAKRQHELTTFGGKWSRAYFCFSKAKVNVRNVLELDKVGKLELDGHIFGDVI